MELLGYTRKEKEDIIYAKRLGLSMHLAWRENQEPFQPFHHNEGILYAKAVSDESDGTLKAKSLKNPWVFEQTDGGWMVIAVRTEAEGEDDPQSEGCVLLFSTKDFVHYKELGLVRLQEQGYVTCARAVKTETDHRYRISFRMQCGSWMETELELLDGEEHILENTRVIACADTVYEAEVPSVKAAEFVQADLTEIEGAEPQFVISVSEEIGTYMKNKLNAPHCVGMKLSAEGSCRKDMLQEVKAVASYSDGTEVVRKIDWISVEGNKAEGIVHQERFEAPFTLNRADPVCMYRDGRYYFIATNDADGNHTLYMRCSDTLSGIVDAEEALFLDSETYPGIGGLLWAPEFHEIGGKLYVFHAATSGEFYCEESRVRVLRDGGDPMCKEDWSEPKLVVKKDGTPLCEEGKVISLDMTPFYYEGDVYVMWSQRQFLPVDQGAWLYLAKVDEAQPWKLISDPVCIAKPEYGWENNHTFVVEGPYALWKDGQLMITYAAAAIDATYTVGLLKPVMGSDIMQPQNWRKNNYALMSARSAEGEYGPGHNSYLTDENGLVWNFYHMKPGVEAPRSAAARRTHFDVDGEPVLDLLHEADLPEAFCRVEIALEEETAE